MASCFVIWSFTLACGGPLISLLLRFSHFTRLKMISEPEVRNFGRSTRCFKKHVRCPCCSTQTLTNFDRTMNSCVHGILFIYGCNMHPSELLLSDKKNYLSLVNGAWKTVHNPASSFRDLPLKEERWFVKLPNHK